MKIQILMSTYNGSRYIRTQLDSIAAQSVEDRTLLIRDDGSTDDTVAVIEDYQHRYPWIKHYEEKNIGVRQSFFDLISHSDPDADYIALADQDDEWLPGKLERAIRILEGKNEQFPALYCSHKIFTDENLQPVPVTVSSPVRMTCFGNALVQNICTGCTAVMNRFMVRMLKENRPQNIDKIVMHDWWLYLTAACFGKVYYDRDAYIRYRQHGANTFGAIMSRRKLLSYRIGQLFQSRGEIYRQNEEFLRTYESRLKEPEYAEEYRLLTKLLKTENSVRDRFSAACDRRYFRQKRTDDVIFRGILIAGKL